MTKTKSPARTTYRVYPRVPQTEATPIATVTSEGVTVTLILISDSCTRYAMCRAVSDISTLLYGPTSPCQTISIIAKVREGYTIVKCGIRHDMIKDTEGRMGFPCASKSEGRGRSRAT